jgi:tyrosyl-tRNA synthetase
LASNHVSGEVQEADAWRNLSQKGIRLNGKQPAGENPTVSAADFLEGEVLVVQRGKRNNYLVLLQG